MNEVKGALLLGAYVLGSIPTGYWLGLAKGVDIRRHGSGNVGATNVLRVLGPGPGAATFTIDFLKGFLPILAAHHFFPNDVTMAIGAGLLAIFGHCTSIFVHFRGGKGVATSAGVFAGLIPVPFIIGISVFAIVAAATRYVSLGSLLGALTLTASSFIFSAPRPLEWTALVATLFVFYTHRANIQRLCKGTEHRVEWRKKQ